MTPQQLKAMKMALEALKTSMYPQQKQLQAITALEKALAEHAMQEVQRLGQEIEPDDIASIIACRDMLDAQPVPPRTWVGLTDEERYLNDGRTEEEIEYARAIEAKLKEKNT
jgi:hypothetical protein